MQKSVVAIISDTHIGGSTALSTPEFSIHTARPKETQTVAANRSQAEFLYTNWIDFWDYVKTLAGVRGKHRKRRIIIIHLGDVIEGIHHGSFQLMNEVADQMNLAESMLLPLANLADAMYLTYGTDAHNGGAGSYEAQIAQNLGINHDWEYTLDIDGTVIDIGHHGRAGGRDWTSTAASIASEVIIDYAKLGLRPPRYVFRGHAHVVDDSGEKIETTRAICCPSWQLRTAFGYKVAKNHKRSDIGGVILVGGELDLCKLRYHAAETQREVIKV